MMTAESISDGAEQDWLAKVLPIVRTRKRHFWPSRRQTIALYRESLVVSWMKNPIPEDCYASDGIQRLLAGRHVPLEDVIPLRSIERVVAYPPSRITPFYTFKIILSDRGGLVKFKILDVESPNLDVEVPSLIQGLRLLIGPRFDLRSAVPFHLNPWLVFVQLFLLANLALMLRVDLMIAALVFGVLLLGTFVVWGLDHIPKRPKLKKVWHGKDRSDTRPFRSRVLGIFLRAVGGVWLLGVLLFGSQFISISLRLLGVADLDITGVSNILGGFFVTLQCAPGLICLYLGYALGQRDPVYILANDKRKPILYLRSFRDDGMNNLNPTGFLANLAGLGDSRWSNVRLKILKIINNIHPIRICRIALGRCVDSAEEQLGLYLRRFGPFVAIGKPGERFVTPGASRTYVSNQQWQETVLDLLGQAQLVVLQPAQTEGIWWEVEQTPRRVEPRRILTCMVNFRGYQEDYRGDYWRFRLKVEKVTGRPLPRSLGYDVAPCFLYFDPDWTAHLVELSYVSPFLWPFLNRAADFRCTRGPILHGLDCNPPAPPQPPGPPRRANRYAALAFFWYIFLVVSFGNLVAKLQKEAIWKVMPLMSEMPHLVSSEEFREAIAGLSPAEAEARVAELAAKGLSRLDDAALLQRAALMSKILALADTATCAAVARGKADGSQLSALIKMLDPESKRLWFSLAEKAMLGELRGKPVPREPEERAVADALKDLLSRLPRDQSGRLQAVLSDVKQANDEDAAWAVRTLYELLPSMPEPHRSVWARALAQ